MSRLRLLVIFVFIVFNCSGKFDSNGNPIFNNVPIEDVDMGAISISMNYYTINNNIDNKNSSVFVNEEPSLNDYIEFARNLPSYFALISSNGEVKYMLTLLQKNEGSKTSFFYNLINVENKKSTTVSCKVWGEITEKRVDEMILLNYDSLAKKGPITGTNEHQFSFNKMIYGYQSYDKIKEEISQIAKVLLAPKLTTKKELRDFIISESKGGKLDFEHVLAKEKQGLFLYDGVAYNKKDFARYLWGKKVKVLGVKSSKKAIKLWVEINKRELTKPEIKALEKGFSS